MASASRKKTLSPNTSWTHCERVWINGARNARAIRNSQDALHQLHSSELGKPELRLGRDLSETQSEMVAKLQLPPASKKEGFSWMEGTRRETQLHASAEQSSVAEMVQRVLKCSTKCKKCRIKQRAKTGSGDRLVSKVLPHKHGVLSSNTQDTFKPHKAAVL